MTPPAGLTTDEARARLVSHGPNRLVTRDRAAWLKDAISLFLDPMALMLLGAAVHMMLGQTRDGVVMLIALAP